MTRGRQLLLGTSAVALALALALTLQRQMPVMSTEASVSAGEKRFTVEVSRNGFKVVEGPVHQMKGETHLAINQGDQVTITFVYADTDYGKNNPHRIAISRIAVDAGIVDADDPQRTVTFTARREGEALFQCVKLCEGHKRLQSGRLMVQPLAGAITAQPTRLAVDFPGEFVRGKETALAAILTDVAGSPISDEPVRFLASADFFVQEWMEVGAAMTDSSGVAVVKYRPAQRGDVQIMASFSGDSAYQASEMTSNAQLLGASRIYEVEGGLSLPQLGPKGTSFGGAPGFRVPPVAALALSVLILVIWGTYLFVVTQVYRISREP
ncbi:MAG: hypothetical protein HYX97_03805 [Chloroflexi bacterium]|nr:hypothetical protein [Chloroflexota bacterium]